MQSQDISAWPVDNSGHPADELAHRFNWTSPMMRSPHDPDAIYVGSEVVWKTTNHGHSWDIISPDLTRNDRSKQTASGGPLTKDITSVEYYDTVFALAESPLAKGMLWAGSDDGLVHVSADDGGHWDDVTPGAMKPSATKPGGALQWSAISMIEPSHFDAATVYVAVDRHKLDDIGPYAFKTTDRGHTWQAITTGLPDGAVVHAIREDPAQRGLLYAGTERGVFVSFDDCRALADPAAQPPRQPGARPDGARRRFGDRHARPRVLDTRRHHAIAPAPSQGGRGGHGALHAGAGDPAVLSGRRGFPPPRGTETRLPGR